MKRILLLSTMLLSLLAAGALLAAPAVPAPQTAGIELPVVQPAPGAALSPLDGALLMSFNPEPQAPIICFIQLGECDARCGRCGIASFLCDRHGNNFTCRCKTC